MKTLTKLFASLAVLVLISLWGISSGLAQNVCPVPTDIRLIGLTPNSASFAWTAHTPSVTVEIYEVGGIVPVKKVTTTRSEVSLRGLRASTQHIYYLKGICNDSLSSERTPFGIFTTPSVEIPCSQPTGLNASDITETTAKLQWRKVTGATSYVLEYRWVNNARFSVLPVTENTVAQLTQLAGGFTYEVRVRTDCNGASSAYSPSILFNTKAPIVRCDAPRVIVNDVKTHSARVAWDLAMAEYEVSYKKAGETVWISQILNQPAPIELTGLEANTRYDVRVRQFCGNISSDYGSAFLMTQDDFTLCEKPIFSADTITPSSATLMLQNGFASLFEISYKKERESVWVSRIVNAPDPQPTVRPFRLENLDENTTYQVRMRRFCTDRFSDYTETVTFTTLRIIPCNPAIISVNQLMPNSVALSVSNQSLLYEISYRNINSARWTVDYSNRPMDFVIDNLQANQTYEVKVRNQCADVFSVYSNTVRFKTPEFLPQCDVPNISVFNVTDQTAQIAWDTPVSAIELRYKTVADANEIVLLLDQNLLGTLFLDNLMPETAYEVRIRAVCNGLFSDYSNTVNFTTSLDPTKCYAPIHLTATNITFTTAAIQWTVPPLVSRYRVEYRPMGSTRWTAFNTTANGSFTLVGLRASTEYELRMITLCPMSVQSDTAQISFTTLAGRMDEINSSETNISFYPNPVKDVLSVTGLENGSVAEIILTDLLGKTVLHQVLDSDNSINITDIPMGVYVIRIGSFTGRLIKE